MLALTAAEPGTTLLAVSRAEELLSDDPWWLIIGKAVAIFGVLVVFTLFNIWFERRVVARMQHRVGPNRAGPFGLLQSLADGVKLALKEDITPVAADKVVFVLAPMIAVVPAFIAFAVIPFGPEVTIFGEQTVLQLADFPVAVLYVVAIASIGIYGIVLAGWSSGSTYPLLGGLRSSAQMISYEVAMSLSFVAVFVYAGSMSTYDIVAAQASGGSREFFGLTLHAPSWFAIALLPSFVIYLVSMVGETNRAPFDLPESEGELVGGFHTEYSSLKFALFFLAEYVNMVTVSAVATTLFLGGWRAPWPLSIWDGANAGWWPVLWFLGKLLALIFVFVWLRGTLPRLRYDQFMKLGWKVLIPASIAWIVAIATIRTLSNEYDGGRGMLVLWVVILLFVTIVGLVLYDYFAGPPAEPSAHSDSTRGRTSRAATSRAFDPMASGYPVPPMPGQHLPDMPGSVVTAAAPTAGPALNSGADSRLDDTNSGESSRA